MKKKMLAGFLWGLVLCYAPAVIGVAKHMEESTAEIAELVEIYKMPPAGVTTREEPAMLVRAALSEAASQEIYEGVDPQELECDELELLAICVEAEAGNQDLLGKRLVVDVILNRVDDADWPDTITEVISQPYAFSSFWDGGMERVIEPSETTFKAVRMELEERSYPGLYYFRTDWYSDYGEPWRKVGDHYFSKK